MHWPFVTTVKFENEDGNVIRLAYAVTAVDMTDAKTELERRFLDLEVHRYTIEKNGRGHHAPGADAQATSALRHAACLSRSNLQGVSDGLSSARRDLPNQ